MYSTDPIADMLTRLRNALMVRKANVSVPYSKMKEQIAQILLKNGYIDSFEVTGTGIDKSMVIVLHDELSQARITNLERVSKPGRRVYSSASDIPTIKNGRGIVVLSTSKGLMTGNEAKSSKIGGEILCSVY